VLLGILLYKYGDLKLYLWTLANRNFGEFLRFFTRGLYPFKIQISDNCRIYISNSVSNWKFGQWTKLFLIIISISFEFSTIFGGRKDVSLYF
jgi:uncharacterized membrane protein YbaN (DUF454 family)